tara:strand:+ start:282 stop:389 length:108 start_codon:yes stop_codon:yes gene_type:complete
MDREILKIFGVAALADAIIIYETFTSIKNKFVKRV